MKKPAALGLVALAIVMLSTGPLPAATVAVNATSNVFGAGHTTPPDDGTGSAGTVPPSFSFSPGPNQVVTFTSVAGTVTYNGGANYYGPEDWHGSGNATDISSVDGISGIYHGEKRMFLIGVFLDDTEPSDPAPDILRFGSTGLQDDFGELSPDIAQAFFVGDGLTGTGEGEHQLFHVPEEATRLFLGFADGSNFAGFPRTYSDNAGSLTVSFDITLVPLPAAPIPDTGQEKCYDNTGEITCPRPGEPFYGQDGNYAINPISYTKLDSESSDLPDEATEWAMVRDNVTGLIWEVKTDDGSIHDKDNTYTWCDSNPGTNGGDAGTCGDGADTEDFINALNAEHYGGLSDWRLPSRKELRSIVDYGRHRPAIGTDYFPNTVYAISLYYWSSTTYASNTSNAWRMYFRYGGDDNRNKSDSYLVRAVRGGQPRPLDYLTDNGDGTVTDTTTGLMWEQATVTNSQDWFGGLNYCENLTLAEYQDWRLPNMKELASLSDLGRHDPAVDTGYFPDTASSNYWSSTTYAHSTGLAWRVNAHHGHTHSPLSKPSIHHVRAVRGGQDLTNERLSISTPSQASAWNVGEIMPIAWLTQDVSGDAGISISRDGGKTFEDIAEGTENDGIHEWTVTGPASVNCMLRIEPVDDPSKGTVQGLFAIQYDPDDGLVAYYPFNGNANDESGNGNHGTERGGVSLTADRLGNANSAYSFDGVDDYIEVADSQTLDITSEITMSAWVNPDTQTHDSYSAGGIVINKEFSYELGLTAGTSTVRYAIDNTEPEFVWTDTGESIPVGEWSFIALTYNGDTIRTYINGNLGYEVSDSGNIEPSEEPLGIGARYGGGEVAHPQYWTSNYSGSIDEVRIYARALTMAEIRELHSLEMPPVENTQPNIPLFPAPANEATGTSTQLLLSWSGGDPDAGDTVTYDVHLGVTDPPVKATADQPETTYDPGTLSYATTYYWKIVAKDNHDAETVGPVWSFTTISEPDTTAPTPASNLLSDPLKETWTNDDSIQVSWTAGEDPGGTGVAGYSYVWDMSGSTEPDDTVDTADTSSTSPSLADGDSHYFHIRTVDNSGNASATVHLGPFYTDTIPAGVPTNGSSSSHSVGVCSGDKTVDISWDAPDGGPSSIGGYSILWDKSAGTLPSQIVNSTSTSATSQSLADGTSHYAHLRAMDGAGNWCEAAHHIGPFCIESSIQSPENMTASSEGSRSVTLRWPEILSTDIEGYNVYRSDSEDGLYIQINPTIVSDWVVIDGNLYQRFNDANLINGIKYWYKVTTVSASGLESSPSSAVSAVPKPILGGDFRIGLLDPSQTVSVGDYATFHITIVAEDKFQETVKLSATSSNLPPQVEKAFSHTDIQPTGSTSLEIMVPYATDTGEYSIDINAISESRSHEAAVYLRVVNLAVGESMVTAVVSDDTYRLSGRIVVQGQLLPWQPSGTNISVNIGEPGETGWSQYPSEIDDEGAYRFVYLPTVLGEYSVQATWSGNGVDLSGSESEVIAFSVGKGESQIRCSTETENIEPGSAVEIQIELKPAIEGVPFNLEILKPGQEEPEQIAGLTTQAEGKRLLPYILDEDMPGIWKFKASWEGNDEYIGAISLPLVLYPGIEVGEALIVAGGGIANNTLWPTIEYIGNRFYKVLKRRRFTHEQIFYMSPHTHDYDLQGDGVDDIIIDDHSPSVLDIQNYIENLYPPGLQHRVDENKPLVIYLVDHGGIGKFKVNHGGHLQAGDMDAWLDALQEATNCKVVVIVETCHSGTFILRLAPTEGQERILISSSNTEISNYDQRGVQSFSQVFMDVVSQGDNLRNCYYKAREKLSNRYLFSQQYPQLIDGQDGLLAADFYIGGTFLVGDILPEILATTPNQAIHAGSFSLFAHVLDVEGVDAVWVSLMPPNFVVIETTVEFETPEINLPKVDLIDPDGNDTYEGSYDFVYDGTYTLTFFVRDTDDNIVTQEVRLAVDNGIDPEGDVNGDGTIALADAILSLKIACGLDTTGEDIVLGADVNGDGRIGLAEMLYVIQKVAGLR